METFAHAIPVIGPLLADAGFRNWILGVLIAYIAIGFFPEESIQADGTTKRTWRFGGIVRAFIQQTSETRELRVAVGALVQKMDRVVTVLETRVGIRIPDSDPPPAVDVIPVTRRPGRSPSIPDA